MTRNGGAYYCPHTPLTTSGHGNFIPFWGAPAGGNWCSLPPPTADEGAAVLSRLAAMLDVGDGFFMHSFVRALALTSAHQGARLESQPYCP